MEAKTRDKIAALRARKGRDPIVCLTAYTTPVARIVGPVCDLVLVGDSLGMVVYGMDTTQGVTMDMMIRHGQAVRRGCPDALVVVDMPYGSYENGVGDALNNARRIFSETGCDAVKLEGGVPHAAAIAAIAGAGMPVMGHIGLLPQSYGAGDVYRIQGKTSDDVERLLADAKAVEAAGAFCMVIEGTIETVAEDITKNVTIPTIGIGASASCDGQILVSDDLLGLNPRPAKFVGIYANLAQAIDVAVRAYADDVRARRFPQQRHVYQKKA